MEPLNRIKDPLSVIGVYLVDAVQEEIQLLVSEQIHVGGLTAQLLQIAFEVMDSGAGVQPEPEGIGLIR